MKNRLTSVLLLILFLVVFTVLSRLFGGAGITLDFDEDALTAGGPKKFSVVVEYDSIDSLELVELDSAGTLISGGENRSCFWGTWENDAWGQYTLCAAKKADTAILNTTQDHEIIVFNYQNNDTTAEMFQMFTELLTHRTMPGAEA